MNDTEKKLVKLLKAMDGIDNDFGLLVCMTCRHEGLTDELVEWIEKERISNVNDVETWLFGENDEA